MKYILQIALGFAASKLYIYQIHAFTPSCTNLCEVQATTPKKNKQRGSCLWYVSTDLPDLSEMKSVEMKKELESYGLSTKSLFDKAEFEKALREARLKQGANEPQTVKDRINIQNDHASTKEKRRKTTWGKPRKERKQRWEEREETSANSTPKETRDKKYHNAFQEGIAMTLSEL
jgi:hypothetical protein